MLQTFIEEAIRLKSTVHKLPQIPEKIIIVLIAAHDFPSEKIGTAERKAEKLIDGELEELSFEVEIIYPGFLHTEKHIRQLAMRYPLEPFVQAAGFGDGHVFQQLFFHAYKQFGERYQVLDWNDQSSAVVKTILPVHISDWQNEFRSFVADNDYTAALELLNDLPSSRNVQIMQHLLCMLIDRLNFSFKNALQHLKEVEQLSDSSSLLRETKQLLLRLVSENKKVQDLELIVELYRQLDLYLDMDDTPSFLVRFYRAREAVLYYLLHYSQVIPFAVQKRKTSTIYDVIEELEERYIGKELDGCYGVYFYLKSQNVAKLLEVRNRSFLGHSRFPVDTKTMWTYYYGTPYVSPAKAKKRFLADTSLMFRDLGLQLDENINQLNEWLLSLSLLISKEEGGKDESSLSPSMDRSSGIVT